MLLNMSPKTEKNGSTVKERNTGKMKELRWKSIKWR